MSNLNRWIEYNSLNAPAPLALVKTWRRERGKEREREYCKRIWEFIRLCVEKAGFRRRIKQ